MARNNPVWFPAKRFGWGWGLPCHWKGWVVFIGFFGAIAATSLKFNPADDPVAWIARMIPITVVFLAICWLKGEKPRWRWGGD